MLSLSYLKPVPPHQNKQQKVLTKRAATSNILLLSPPRFSTHICVLLTHTPLVNMEVHIIFHFATQNILHKETHSYISL